MSARFLVPIYMNNKQITTNFTTYNVNIANDFEDVIKIIRLFYCSKSANIYPKLLNTFPFQGNNIRISRKMIRGGG